jgi:uncharacterized protein (DUF2235 family)
MGAFAMQKKLIVFCDGTWNRADQHSDGKPCPTNVLRLFESTLAEDRNGVPQITHYIEGVGTHKMERFWGGGFGYGISDNIKNAYSFIVSNYEKGDEIFLFGFSRGAFTARSIAGLIRNMGILRRDRLHLVHEAYNQYRDPDPKWGPDSEMAKAFRQANTFGGETIAFLGVWDTVGALGAPFGVVLSWITNLLFKCRFHDVRLSTIVESAYHAVAIDERRWPFRPTLWELNETHLARNAESLKKDGTLLYEQKWFPGVHSNVGGGYPNAGLSDCSLQWMAEKAGERGLNADLSRIDCPRWQPDLHADIDNSQTLAYRLATIAFVKLPAPLLKKFDKSKDAALIDHVLFNGDYVRPVGSQGNVAEAVKNFPSIGDYQGDVSRCAIEKLSYQAPLYRPRNISLS